MEPRLIDANELYGIEALLSCAAKTPESKFLIEQVLFDILNMPTVDAVPVVRCGACRYYNTDDCAMVDYCDGCDCKVDLRFDESGFCSHGEPRTPPAE